MKIDFDEATKVLEEEVEISHSVETSGFWVDLVKKLSEECEIKNKTMIAMLGTALLAKATNIGVDPYSLKVGGAKEGNTYSARALCKEVLAANSKRLGIDLGVTGREPLNNQPFFGKDCVSEDLPISASARKALDILLNALSELDKLKTQKQARIALRSFLQVRKKKKSKVSIATDDGDEYSVRELTNHICSFVNDNSEGGKRAQAVSAGLLDVLYGKERVDAKRINDPGKKMPGDIGIISATEDGYDRVFEVKDKPVTIKDVQILIDNISDSSVSTIGLIAVSSQQEAIDIDQAIRWAEAKKVKLRIFIGWNELVTETLYWSEIIGITTGYAYRSIIDRIEEYEISQDGIDKWTI